MGRGNRGKVPDPHCPPEAKSQLCGFLDASIGYPSRRITSRCAIRIGTCIASRSVIGPGGHKRIPLRSARRWCGGWLFKGGLHRFVHRGTDIPKFSVRL